MCYVEECTNELLLHQLSINFVAFSPKFQIGTHWIFEIVSLIVHGGDPSKIERSHMVVGLEMSIMNMTNPDAITQETPPGYKVVDTWESPRVVATHLDQRLFPPDAWKKKAKVTLKTRCIHSLHLAVDNHAYPVPLTDRAHAHSPTHTQTHLHTPPIPTHTAHPPPTHPYFLESW